MQETILARVKAIAERVASSEGLEVVDLDLVGGREGRVLRIFLDKSAGVTHADCETVSQQVGVILDVEDVIPGGRYALEVSSPGVERRLSRPQDFVRFQGQKVKIALRQPVDGRRHWEGTLASYSEGVVTLEPSSGERLTFGLDQIQKANLKFEW
jgi:ribosome maturation factor RimP